MITYLKNNDIDKNLWDQCILHATNGIIYAYSWYLDIVAPGWDGLVYKNYEYVFPIIHKKKFGIHYIYPPFFLQHLEIYGQSPTLGLLKEFLSNIPSRFKYLEMHLAGWDLNNLSNFEVKPRTNIEIKKEGNYDDLYTQFSKNHKRNIAKAKKHKVSVIQDDNFITTINIFKQNKGVTLGYNAQHYEILQRLMSELLDRKTGFNYLVFNENDVCGGAFFTLSHQRMIFLFSGLTPKGRSLGAMHLLISEVISKNYPKFEVFDFEGSNNENLANFYLGFGGKSLQYYRIINNMLPWYVSWFK